MAYGKAGPQAMPPPAGGTSRRCVAARHATRLRAEGCNPVGAPLPQPAIKPSKACFYIYIE